MTKPRRQTRIQQRNRRAILDAALAEFSNAGFAGATLDAIALAAGLSKPNLLYYFPSKEAIYLDLLSALMSMWLDPLLALDADGEPIEEIVAYALRKLRMSRDFPRESRLFANEIVSGAPRFAARIEGELKNLVDDKAALIAQWQDQGLLAAMEPRHLIFSIWAVTQHYADFDAQVRGILAPHGNAHFDEAERFVETFYRHALAPEAGAPAMPAPAARN
ncbi:TetR family transcriptional regulator C-terminal domain-containing protein [Profundibacterium mesophilum]|uniref:Transcriptional regulator TetR family protein n=1 Tax=Profundibacterium mesophilum KAUST100406-0324 TaxID=1037889 RepID=A0A921TCK4_9RHOB|nr:TetR family transcriptional regulator C-terminal domain-containing protein [Profundibacterium mesophilum]KAF0674997.1 Transcriptional regulator TetR family protein [Profundibacterium mesophilum KAUST100406-0324]